MSDQGLRRALAWPVLRAVLAGQLVERPLRLALTVLALALGVALAAGVFLVNASALEEFTRATRQLAGQADLVVRGPRDGFGESLYPELARRPEVALASPALELEAALAQGGTLRILGVDPFTAGSLQPELYGELAASLLDLLAPDAIALSATAARQLDLGKGDVLTVRVGATQRRLRVVAVLSESVYPQRLGVMDIGSAQWTLERLGRLNRIDLRLAAGADVERLRALLAPGLPAGVQIATPELERERSVRLTRAYRVNLDMLALVALLTGAFLVFATQALGVLRRRSQFALLRALGVTRGELRTALLAEGALVGLAGGLVGTALGWLLAFVVLRELGGDLGAGYFDASAAGVSAGPATLAAFVALAVAIALAGAWVPARRGASLGVAAALKAGDTEPLVEARHARSLGFMLLAAGTLCGPLPPVMGLPLFGYLAVALLLFGAVLLVPWFAAVALGALPARGRTAWRLAVAQLRGTVAESTVSLAAIVVSFSLMVAMAIMVHSFRHSFERWLGEVLPADLNLRIAPGNDTAFWSRVDQEAIAALPGVARVEFRRVVQVYLVAEQSPVSVIARPIDPAHPGATLPMLALAAAAPADGLVPVYASEAMRDLYGWRVGTSVQLPIAGEMRRVWIAGTWRDYARSTGTVVVPLDRYRAWTGDTTGSEAAIWLAPGAAAVAVEAAIRRGYAQGREFQIYTTTTLKERSLRLFDRAFAITYALEAIAVLIGLFGVSFTFASQALARRAEFGMLRHLGLARRQLLAMLACEGALVGALGAAYGLVVGGILSVVLVYVIDRQSFHWSLDFSMPLLQLASISLALVAAAAVTAAASARALTSAQALRAVREDW